MTRLRTPTPATERLRGPQAFPVQPPRRPGMPDELPHISALAGVFTCCCGSTVPATPCPWDWLEAHRGCGSKWAVGLDYGELLRG